MSENAAKGGFVTKIREAREKYLPYNEKTIKILSISAAVMIGWLLVWALIFKLCDSELLGMTYTNLKNMTPMERIVWDLIPFNYRGTEYWKMRQVIDTILNCFVFAPFGILFCYTFKKKNLLRNAALCLSLSFLIEMTQLATMLGNPATEDLLTNTVGCFIGYGMNSLFFERLSVKVKTVLCASLNLVCIVVVIYSLITMVNAADTIYGIMTRTL